MHKQLRQEYICVYNNHNGNRRIIGIYYDEKYALYECIKLNIELYNSITTVDKKSFDRIFKSGDNWQKKFRKKYMEEEIRELNKMNYRNKKIYFKMQSKKNLRSMLAYIGIILDIMGEKRGITYWCNKFINSSIQE